MVYRKRVVSGGKTVEEEPVGVKEKGVLACEHCGGELEEREGGTGRTYYCKNCGKTTRFEAKLISEAAAGGGSVRVSENELKEFKAKLRALSFTEFLDFCWRLYFAIAKKKFKSHYDKTPLMRFYSRNEKRGEAILKSNVSLAWRKEQSCSPDLIYCNKNEIVSEAKMRELVEIVRKEKTGELVVCAPEGFEEAALDYAKSFTGSGKSGESEESEESEEGSEGGSRESEEVCGKIVLWDARALAVESKRRNEGAKTLRPVVTEEKTKGGYDVGSEYWRKDKWIMVGLWLLFFYCLFTGFDPLQSGGTMTFLLLVAAIIQSLKYLIQKQEYE